MSEEKNSVNWGMRVSATWPVCRGLYWPSHYRSAHRLALQKKIRFFCVDKEGQEAVNFNISYTIYVFVAGLLCSILIGYALLPFLVLAHLGLIIWATLKANKGEHVRYPLTLRFIR